jgi:hypothetical protein
MFRKVQLSGPSTSSLPLTIMPKQLLLSPSARNPDFPQVTLGRACRFVLGLEPILPTRSLCHGRGGGRAGAAAEPGRGARRAGPGGGLGGVRAHRARQAPAQRSSIRARRWGRTVSRRVLRQEAEALQAKASILLPCGSSHPVFSSTLGASKISSSIAWVQICVNHVEEANPRCD